jgi:hypothetical protein
MTFLLQVYDIQYPGCRRFLCENYFSVGIEIFILNKLFANH